MGFGVKKGAAGNLADQHLLQGHCLRTELQAVGVVLLRGAVFILHRHGEPAALLSLQRDTIRVGAELHHIAGPGQAQPVADDPHAAHRQQVTPLFPKGIVVAPFMQQLPLDGAQVFGPLLFEVNQRPLPPAKAEVLDAGHQQVVVCIHQDNLSQLTPAGRVSSSQTR